MNLFSEFLYNFVEKADTSDTARIITIIFGTVFGVSGAIALLLAGIWIGNRVSRLRGDYSYGDYHKFTDMEVLSEIKCIFSVEIPHSSGKKFATTIPLSLVVFLKSTFVSAQTISC